MSGIPPTGQVGTYYVATFHATNNPTSWSSMGTLPPGLSFSNCGAASACSVAGTPTLPGTYNFAICAANANGSGCNSVTVTILAASSTIPIITSPSGAIGYIGTNYTAPPPPSASLYTITATYCGSCGACTFQAVFGWVSVRRMRTIDLMPLKPYFHGTTSRSGAPFWLGSVRP